MKKIGLTGGIGSGKTTVARVFEVLGVPVFYSDVEAKRCMQEDLSLVADLKSVFGEHIYEEGQLQKEVLAKLIFQDSQALKKINALVHPAVQRRFEQWCAQQHSPYVLKEAAILFEAAADKGLDAVICVTAPDEIRLERVIRRDGSTAQEVKDRMAKQWSQAEKVNRSSYHIVNDGVQAVLPQIMRIHEDIIRRTDT